MKFTPYLGNIICPCVMIIFGGRYLYEQGFVPFLLPESCPSCITVKRFCVMFPHGTYIIGTGSHAVAVIDGNYYNSWDSGDEIPSYFWRIK